MINLEDYSYHLPKKLIAQEPVRPRDASRLMVVRGNELEHLIFKDIVDYFKPGDVLVLNNTKVVANKLQGKKLTGAEASVVIEGKENGLYKARVETRNPQIGLMLSFPGELLAEVRDRKDDVFFLKFNKSPEPVLREFGELPTPGYIRRPLERDEEYQTEFSRNDGSLAAPTSGLHFTKELIGKLKQKGVKICFVTLHISFGTFKKIDESKPVEENRTELEYYWIPKETADCVNKRDGRLVVCGTTVFKALESAQEKGQVIAGENYSDLFIYSGHEFKVKPDMMITNFHLPKSSLLLFVSAYFGRKTVLDAYREAVEKEYRFFSLGDACLFIK